MAKSQNSADQEAQNFMEQSRFLSYGLVGRTGQGKESTVQGVHLQPRLWRRLHSSVCPNS